MATVSPFGDVTVYTSDSVAVGETNWVEQPNMRAESLMMAVAPSLQQARVRLEYGNIKRRNATSFAFEARQNWHGKFFRIKSEQGGIDWAGVCTRVKDRFGEELNRKDPDDEEAPDDYQPDGTQTFIISGWEWYLARSYQLFSVTQDVWPPVPSGLLRYVMGCNNGFGYYRDTQSNDTGNKSTQGLAFATRASQREKWTGLTFVQYLLKHHVNATIPVIPRPVVLAPESFSYLTYNPTVQTRGVSLFQIINQIIKPQRGLVWWLDWSNIDGLPIYLIVDSMTQTTISLPSGGEIPGNRNVTSVSGLGADAKLTVDVRRDRYRPAVICRGALQRDTFTISVQGTDLQEGWDLGDSKYQRYLNGGKGHPDHPNYDDGDLYPLERKILVNDRIRDAEEFEHFFSLFVVPDNWDGRPVGNGQIGNVLDPNTSQPIQVGYVPAMLHFTNQLPLKVGLDYTDPSSPTGNIANQTDPEFLRPFAVANVSGSAGSPAWRNITQIAKSEWDIEQSKLKGSYGLAMSHGQPGVQLIPRRMQHTAAKNVMAPGSYEPSKDAPEIDYREIHYTVCAETMYYAESQYPLDVAPSGDLMVLYLGDRYRYDTMQPGTVFDAQDGKLKQASYDPETEPEKGVLQDDRALLADFARLAYEWYAVTRGSMELTTKLDTTAGLELGFYVEAAGFNVSMTTVNAVVSQIAVNFPQGTITYGAGFSELDFANL